MLHQEAVAGQASALEQAASPIDEPRGCRAECATVEVMDSHELNSDPSGRPEGKLIGAAAAELGVSVHVLRHWEDVGVLVPARDALGRRRYGDADLRGDERDREALLREHGRSLESAQRELAQALATVTAALSDPGDRACPYSLR
ncbi:helix-turn-helix domain-containing protein [Actinomyces slackii]|uniref:helix-turn-helix domain-containing protein n=2 Tax=Actinomyces slackii TaxID=52774 RepID=UPI0039E89503